MSWPDHIEQDHLFWSAEGRVDTYDLEEPGNGYTGWPKMVKQQPSAYYHGDWVRAEDYRRDIERLENILKENRIAV